MQTAKVLAEAVIPNEYGINPEQKLRIGSKICNALLGKLLADLGNMRDESLATAVCIHHGSNQMPLLMLCMQFSLLAVAVAALHMAQPRGSTCLLDKCKSGALGLMLCSSWVVCQLLCLFQPPLTYSIDSALGTSHLHYGSQQPGYNKL